MEHDEQNHIVCSYGILFTLNPRKLGKDWGHNIEKPTETRAIILQMNATKVCKFGTQITVWWRRVLGLRLPVDFQAHGACWDSHDY